jgi:3-oxoacyl-[acyl-carrier-protein] synthase-3
MAPTSLTDNPFSMPVRAAIGCMTNAPLAADQLLSESRMAPQSLIYLSRPASVLGSRVVTTQELTANLPDWTVEEAVKRTGVETRHWLGEHEDVVSLAISAANRLFDRLADLPPLSLIACSTTTPKEATPSIACQVATALADRATFRSDFHAFDFNAACSGFLYGLRLAWDHLKSCTDGAVLLLTAESISAGLNLHDAATCFLFGDAASATLVANTQTRWLSLAITRPRCFATPDPIRAIWAPCYGANGHLQMDGIAVARTAYKAMAAQMAEAATEAGIHVKQLSAILPHPGSKRILHNVSDFLEFDRTKVWHTLADTGNTSSSSIPLALDHYWERLALNQPIGFTAFGAGFTSAAAVGHMNGETHYA